MTETKIIMPEHTETKVTDARGRVTLGNEFADCRVTIAVVESEPRD